MKHIKAPEQQQKKVEKSHNKTLKVKAVIKKGQKGENEQVLCVQLKNFSQQSQSSGNINLWIPSQRESLQLRTGI